MSIPRTRTPTPTNHGTMNGMSVGSSRGRQSGLRSRATQLLALRFGWVVLVIWFEVGEFFRSLSSCKFPDSALRRPEPPSSGFSLTRSRSRQTPPTHVVLLADPHVPHPRLSYPSDARPWVNKLRQMKDELFMRKSWNVVMRLGRVDAVIVLGDMLDWGRGAMSDSEYENYYSLFHSIFQLPSSIPIHFVPGNHDLPLGPNRLFSPYARDRYASHFSPPNSVLSIANHSFVLLDAVGLVEEDYRRYAAEMQFGEWDGMEGGVIEFVKDLGDNPPPGPKILISHIPLARAEAATCGPLRESGRIVKGAGPGYQNLLGSETSRFLLEEIKPSVVFSGDDHDYCDHTHSDGTREVTLKTFSSDLGIRRPGLQLLSLVQPDVSSFQTMGYPTHADRPCFLPDQAGVYTRVYTPLILITLLYLLVTNIRSSWNRFAGQAGHGYPYYGDVAKGRISPAMSDIEKMPNSAGLPSSRRLSDRPVPLTLPSRKSQSHLAGLGQLTPSMMPRSARLSSGEREKHELYTRSAPVSPRGSPRQMSYEDDGDDVVLDSGTNTPNMSRRSSYIYMNGSHDRVVSGGSNGSNSHGHGAEQGLTGGVVSQEPGSYFLPLPSSGTASGSAVGSPGGGGYGYPSAHPLRRTSSNVSTSHGLGGSAHDRPPSSSHAYPYPQQHPHPHPHTPGRGLPRMLSASPADWAAAAKAKDKSVLGFMADSLPVIGIGAGSVPARVPAGGRRTSGTAAALAVGMGVVDTFKGYARWVWKARNSVVIKTWRELLAVAWPCSAVWVIVNGLYFL